METGRENILSMEEARRAAQHEQLRGQLEADANRRISTEARQGMADEPRIEAVAQELRRKTISEVQESERELSTLKTAARINQFIDYAFYLLYGLLGLRFLLALMGANNNAGFLQFVKGVTAPFYQPFRNIVASPSIADTSSTLAAPILVALIVYFMLHLALRGLLRLLAERRTQL